MRYFLKKIAGFGLVLLVSVTVLFATLSHKHRFLPSLDYYSKEFNKAFENKNYDIVALGNSKLLSSLDVDVLNNELKQTVVNLAYSSADISISKLTLEAYLNKCIRKPSIVVLEVSWFTFNSDRTFFHPIYGDLLLKDYHLLKHLMRYHPYALQYARSSGLEQVKSAAIPVKYTDYSSFMSKPSNIEIKDYEFDVAKFNEIFPDQRAGISAKLLDDFNELISMCSDNNIKLIMYTAPEDESYTDMQKDRTEIINIYQALSSDIDHVHYFNYTKGGNLYDKEYEFWLYDSHHLNEKKLFSQILANDINKVILN